MDMWNMLLFSEDNGCGEGCNCDDHGEFNEMSDPVLEIEDPETGETFSFLIADEFELEDDVYYVLVEDNEEAEEYFIVRLEEDEDGEAYVATLEEDEADSIYEAYDLILDEYFEDEDEAFDEDEDFDEDFEEEE